MLPEIPATSTRSGLSCLVSLLGLTGVLLCLFGPMFPAGAQDSRVLQVWPDRSIGVTSGLLEGVAVYTATQVFSFGVSRTSAGDVVCARTYLHFPLDVFPPGAEILRAALYVYVDSGSGVGEATMGAYRVLEPWEEGDLGDDPAGWPRLLTSPIAATTARFDVVAPMLPVPTPALTATSTLASTPTLTATETSSNLFSKPASRMSIGPGVQPGPAPPSLTSPLSTPTPTSPTSPLPTPTPIPSPTSTSTPGPTPTSPATPLPTPSPRPSPDAPVLSLGRVAGTWLTWDVTALMRAWLAGEVPRHGLALASAPAPDAGPDTAGDLLVARWLTADDPGTRPYIVAEFKVHPVTPTPTFTPGPVLPSAGSPVGWGAAGLLFIGAALLVLGLVVRRG